MHRTSALQYSRPNRRLSCIGKLAYSSSVAAIPEDPPLQLQFNGPNPSNPSGLTDRKDDHILRKGQVQIEEQSSNLCNLIRIDDELLRQIEQETKLLQDASPAGSAVDLERCDLVQLQLSMFQLIEALRQLQTDSGQLGSPDFCHFGKQMDQQIMDKLKGTYLHKTESGAHIQERVLELINEVMDRCSGLSGEPTPGQEKNFDDLKKMEETLREKLQKTVEDSREMKNDVEIIHSHLSQCGRVPQSGPNGTILNQNGLMKKGEDKLKDELQLLRQTVQALKHSRTILEIRKLFDDHKLTNDNDNILNLPDDQKTINWFRKRTSFKADSITLENPEITFNLIQPFDQVFKILNSSAKTEHSTLDRKQSIKYWNDLIEHCEAIVSSEDEDEDETTRERKKSGQRSVSFQSQVEICQEDKKLLKWTTVRENLNKIRKRINNPLDWRKSSASLVISTAAEELMKKEKESKLEIKRKERETEEEQSELNSDTFNMIPLEIKALPGASGRSELLKLNIFKIIFIGDSTVGKTSFISQASGEGFPRGGSQQTIGIDFKVKSVEIDGDKYLVQLWDTAGQERFKCISMNYYRKVDAIALLYDVTNPKSFANVRWWIQSIIENISEVVPVPLLIIANKIDLRESAMFPTFKRQVSTRDGHELVRSLGLGPNCQFVETSVHNVQDIEEAVQNLVRMAIWAKDEYAKVEGGSRVIKLSMRRFGSLRKKPSWKKCC